MATLHRALLTSFLISAIFSSFTYGSEKYVNIASHCLSMFAKHGEMSKTQWFKDLASQLLEKFDEDKEGYKFAFMDIFLRMKFHNSSDPLQGGNVNLKFPVQKFFPSSKIDDMRADITMDGLDDIRININYQYEEDDSFPYKNTQLRNILITRKFVDGQWENKFVFDGSSKPVEIIILSDEATILNITYNDAQNNTNRFDFGFQGLDQIETVFTINEANYRLNVNIDIMEQTVRIVTKMPNNYMEVDMFLKWYSRRWIVVDVFQDVGSFKLNMKRDNVSTLNLNLLMKLVRYGPEKSIEVTMDVGNFKLWLDGTTDFDWKYSSLYATLNGTDYHMSFQLVDTHYKDKWVVEGTGNIFQPVNVYAEFMKDISTGSMTIMFGEERIAFFRAKDIMIFGGQIKATLDYSLNIVGFSGKGSINFNKEDKSTLVGIFTKKYSPMEVEFALTFDDYGSYNINLKYIGDDGFLEEESVFPEREFNRGAQMSMSLDFMTRNFLWTINANDGRQLNSVLTWQNDIIDLNKVEFEAFGNMIWDFETHFTLDWLTPEMKMGFLISREIDLEPLEKMLVNVEEGDMTMLTNPGAIISTIGKQSIYGIGVLGLVEGHVLTGRMNHWDRND